MLIPHSKSNRILLTTLMVVVLGAACGAQPAPVVPVGPLIQTVEVTSEVTRQVTSEVTRLVEVPVTVTPSPTPDFSPTPTPAPAITRTPSLAPTFDPPVVTVLVHAACLFGPGWAYLWDYGLNATSWMEVIGRMPANPNTDPKDVWLWVQGVHGWNPCWVKSEFVRFNDGGDLTTHPEIPIVSYSTQPYSTLYLPPLGIDAQRYGTRVEIYWSGVWMTLDDYEGYVVEAWLCKDGQLTFTPIKWKLPIEKNVEMGLLSMVVEDEPGCLEPSSARIYVSEKHGFTGYKVIPWPPYEPTPTP